MMVTEERCANCRSAIGPTEPPYLYHNNVVCAKCHAKLTSARQAGVSRPTSDEATLRPTTNASVKDSIAPHATPHWRSQVARGFWMATGAMPALIASILIAAAIAYFCLEQLWAHRLNAARDDLRQRVQDSRSSTFTPSMLPATAAPAAVAAPVWTAADPRIVVTSVSAAENGGYWATLNNRSLRRFDEVRVEYWDAANSNVRGVAEVDDVDTRVDFKFASLRDSQTGATVPASRIAARATATLSSR